MLIKGNNILGGQNAFPRSEQVVLGAKNLFGLGGVISKSSNVTLTLTDTAVTLGATTAGTYANANISLHMLPKNTDVIFSFDVTKTTDTALTLIQGKISGGSYTQILNTGQSNDGHYEYAFNTGDYDEYAFNPYCTAGTSTTGTATWTNLMIRLASDPDDTFVPFATSNRELTEALYNAKLSYSGLTPTSCTIADGGYCKIGKLVIVNLRFKPTISTTADISISGFPKYTAPNALNVVAGIFRENADGAGVFRAYNLAGNNGILSLYSMSTAWNTGSDGILGFTYLCD